MIMGQEFHLSAYGRDFFQGQLPKLIKEIGRLADAIEKQNEIATKEEKKEND